MVQAHYTRTQVMMQKTINSSWFICKGALILDPETTEIDDTQTISTSWRLTVIHVHNRRTSYIVFLTSLELSFCQLGGLFLPSYKLMWGTSLPFIKLPPLYWCQYMDFCPKKKKNKKLRKFRYRRLKHM